METPVLAAWDVVVRVWLVVAAWLALRGTVRPHAVARLAGITDPARFARAAIVPAAGHVAIAIAMLPRRHRGEATVTLLACKALHALDQSSGGDAASRDAVTAAVAYLSGEAHDPPRIPLPAGRAVEGRDPASPIAAHGADRMAVLLAARLPALRAALEALPGDAVRRCRAMIERVGERMVRARTERRGGSAHVLGEAVVYAARLAAPSVRPPDMACRAAGCALHLADDLRHAETAERRAWLVSRMLPAASEVVRLARWLPASVGPGTRAAAALLVVTSCAALLREAGVALPRRLHRPLRAAYAAAWSRGAYLAAATAVDAAIRDGLAAHPSLLDGPELVLARPPVAPEIVLARPPVAPDPVVPPPALASLAIELVPPRRAETGELRELNARIGS